MPITNPHSGNRWYDQALSELVIDNLEFDGDAPWWCVEGGSQHIAYRLRDRLSQKDHIEFQKIVTAKVCKASPSLCKRGNMLI